MQKKNKRREATFVFLARSTSKQSAKQTIERDSAGLRVWYNVRYKALCKYKESRKSDISTKRFVGYTADLQVRKTGKTVENKYIDCTDEELIERLHSGENEIMEYMLEKYKFLVRRVSRKLFLIGGEPEDVIQEGMIGLFKAIKDFNPDKEMSFHNFAELCISRQIYSAITASNRKKHSPLKDYVSLSNELQGDGRQQGYVTGIGGFTGTTNPEELVLDKEARHMVEYEIERCLSAFEKQVLQMYLDGMGYVEIAGQLDKAPKSVDNAIQRIRTKLHKLRANV